MPPRGVQSPKRKRQDEHIKESAKKRGKSTGRAKEIAARTAAHTMQPLRIRAGSLHKA